MTENKEEFVSFEKALRDLQMQSAELKKLVSEGEIRAFRDGDSMKFKAEDIEALARSDDDELVFEDSLEDDTGMATEELSDEETLLAEDDLLDEEPAAPARSPGLATTRTSARARLEAESAVDESWPAWAAVAAVACSLLMIWGLGTLYNISNGTPPGGIFTGVFAK